jgi:hypothetical protein
MRSPSGACANYIFAPGSSTTSFCSLNEVHQAKGHQWASSVVLGYDLDLGFIGVGRRKGNMSRHQKGPRMSWGAGRTRRGNFMSWRSTPIGERSTRGGLTGEAGEPASKGFDLEEDCSGGRASDAFGKFRTFIFGCALSIVMVLVYSAMLMGRCSGTKCFARLNCIGIVRLCLIAGGTDAI